LHAYGLNAAWWTETQAFLGVLLHEPLRLVGLYRQWLAGALAATGLPPIAWMVAGAGALAIATWGFARNPYSFRNTEHGGARWATKLHVARMLEDGLFAKQGIVLGRRWGRYIRHFSP